MGQTEAVHKVTGDAVRCAFRGGLLSSNRCLEPTGPRLHSPNGLVAGTREHAAAAISALEQSVPIAIVVIGDGVPPEPPQG